jgi:hypothetical protein
MATLIFVACSHQTQKKSVSAPEPWFENIRAVSSAGLAPCRLLGPVETLVEAAKLVPPLKREDYRQTRRIAFGDFEAKVLAAGGNAVRIDVFIEKGVASNSPFGLDAIHLAGQAVACP